MSAGAVKDYAFAQKAHWRRWQWNRIKERLAARKIHPSRALVLGLFGSDALDVECATRRGFLRDNMIAIERDPRAVSSLRELGVNCIHGTLSEVLASWGPEPKINVLLADLCGGLSSEARRVWQLATTEDATAGCVVSFNSLRGRDTDGPFLAEWLAGARDVFDSYMDSWPQTEPSHRGALVAACYFAGVAGSFVKHGSRLGLPLQVLNDLIREQAVDMAPRFHSYRSGRLVYDGVVFTVVRRDAVGHRPSGLWNSRASRRTAAAKAIRTMRLRP